VVSGAPITPLTGGRLRRTRGRRVMRDVAWVLIITGVLLLADAAVTLLWQEPVTAVVALIKRSQIDQRYINAPLPSPERRAVAALGSQRARIAFLAQREERHVGTGDAVGRIEIPRIGLNLLVVQGTDSASLEKGPGHYSSTALPGLRKTVAIAGHRTTYLAPFRHIDALKPGDPITLKMPYARFVYTVQYHRIVSPSAWWITGNVGYDRLVLSACNPLYSAAQRIVVFARLTSVHARSFTPGAQRSSIAGVVPMMG
jgi:sortase A